ncbi:hypothetical protein GH808_11520 [Acetobacterium fimetarium]|uniref:Uncharacterized protein n=1 Tax=Acetobacterium fimetarium TaxID=52691 RepID=A0ABR6WWP8_9FIRM|nr:hypothetical protein [Acetobacterium fimetarium]MBC3805059.1 hypothetical protein [Acetobacterium fimetarium]
MTVTVPTTGAYANKIQVTKTASPELLVSAVDPYTAAAGTATVTFAPKGDVVTYFGVEKTVSITVTMPVGGETSPAAYTPLTVSK